MTTTTALHSAAVLHFGGLYDESACESALDLDVRRRSSEAPASGSNNNRRNGLSDWQVKKITRHIDQNIRSTLRIADLGELVQLSASHFSRNFKVSFGESPYAYVLSRRISLAKYLICNTEEPLSQIAHDCGMSDQAHMCKLFKRIAGATPYQWRQIGRRIHAQKD